MMNRPSFYNIFQLFLESCKKHAKKLAIHINEKDSSYEEFLLQVCSINKSIKSVDSKSDFIGIYCEDSVKTYSSIWAILSTGKGYFPINKKWPTDRLIEVIENSGIDLIVYEKGNEKLMELKNHFENKINFISTQSYDSSTTEIAIPVIDVNSYAYLLYTSGTSGTPKGVAINHGNLSNLISAHLLNKEYDLNSNDRILQMFELTFDFSVLPTLFSFCSGAQLFVVPENKMTYLQVLKTLSIHKITKAYLVPSVIHQLGTYYHQIHLPELKWSFFCGEALLNTDAENWKKCTPKGMIINSYGPTEATVYVTEFFVHNHESTQHKGIVALGRSINNMGTMLLNEKGEEITETDIEGELYLFGPQVANGYWKNEERTKECFRKIRTENYTGTAYKTGDICIKDKNDILFFVRRSDQQIKLNGYRIELNEIEFHALQNHQVKRAIALLIPIMESSQIVLAIESEKENIEKEILQYLQLKLPPYMLPQMIKVFKSLPLNENGKVDNHELISSFKK